jgi:hypothetical protein
MRLLLIIVGVFITGCVTTAQSVRGQAPLQEPRAGENALLSGRALSDEKKAQWALEYPGIPELGLQWNSPDEGIGKIRIIPGRYKEISPDRYCREFTLVTEIEKKEDYRTERQHEKKYACRIAQELWEPAPETPHAAASAR